MIVLGIDTSCYTTSVAAADENGVLASNRQLLPVQPGARGLRQSEALFAHIRQLKYTGNTDFFENGHQTSEGDLDIYSIVKALVENGFDGYVRPDHGRNIWGEDAKPGYGLFDRALGATYLTGLFEALEKGEK